VSEEEAKTKWCPQTLQARLMVTDHVKLPVEMGGALCIGSACMAWRWAEQPPEIERTIWPSNPAERRKMQAEEEARLVEKFKRRKGFCGLAGRP